MLSGDQVLGVLAVYRCGEEYHYDEDDLEALQILANQGAAALQNFRFFVQMRSAEKAAAISETSAEFLHRTNNQVGTIPVRVGMIRDRLRVRSMEDSKVNKSLDAIEKASNRILSAAREVKNAVVPGQQEFVQIPQAIETALERATVSLSDRENIRIVKEIEPNLPPIWVERNKLENVLINLIKNALDAMPAGGSLGIRVEQSQLAKQKRIEITVSDTGVGISQTDLTRIFDIFYTTKSGSLGFGLWRDRLVIRDLGGEITVRSEVGKGSTFMVFIPLKVQPPNL